MDSTETIEKIRAEVERLKQEGDIALQDAVETNDIESGFVCGGIISTCEKLLAKLDALQEQPVMIEWTGNNLKEVIEFTGKSPRFNEWFKSWDDYEDYVRQHGNIFKMFNDDGSHLEVPVGAWIVKTPDKRCVASKFTLKQPESEKIAAAYQLGLADKEKQMIGKINGLVTLEYSNRCFLNGVEKGRKEMRKEMMKEAVEGIAVINANAKEDGFGYVRTEYIHDDVLRGLGRFKIIIVKED